MKKLFLMNITEIPKLVWCLAGVVLKRNKRISKKQKEVQDVYACFVTLNMYFS